MIDTDDIRAAVGAGVLNERQAAALTALAHSRRGAREALDPGDEPFELFRGMNEIFIIVGLLILATGWFGVAAWAVFDQLSTWKSTVAVYSLATAGLIWALSEYFIRRRRMVGPAILLSIFFAVNAFAGLGQYFAQVFLLAKADFSSLIVPAVLSVVMLFVFWLRFKVPFAMALIALGLFGTALLVGATERGLPGDLSDIFVFSAESGFAWITLALGLATFAFAMVFDGSDPHRVTRRSAQGFWLHLVAAPMIINTVALSLLSSGSREAMMTVALVMVGFAIVAVVIDRRSFLLAAIGYLITVIFALNPMMEDAGGAFIILGLGVFLVLLGAFWARIRAGLLGLLPLGRARAYLPPAH